MENKFFDRGAPSSFVSKEDGDEIKRRMDILKNNWEYKFRVEEVRNSSWMISLHNRIIELSDDQKEIESCKSTIEIIQKYLDNGVQELNRIFNDPELTNDECGK